jgi:hypothetical protein
MGLKYLSKLFTSWKINKTFVQNVLKYAKNGNMTYQKHEYDTNGI